MTKASLVLLVLPHQSSILETKVAFLRGNESTRARRNRIWRFRTRVGSIALFLARRPATFVARETLKAAY